MTKRFKNILLLIAPFFFWGTAMVAMKGVMEKTTPLFLAGIRLLPAGILVLVVAIIFKRKTPSGWKAWLWIIFFAIVDGAMFQGFLALGLVKTGAGLGSVIIDSQPVVVTMLSVWLFGEILGIFGILGLTIAIIGISLIGLPDELILNLFQGHDVMESFMGNNLFHNGEWLMLIASMSMAVGTVTIRFVSRYADPIVATGWHMILGGLSLFILSGIWESQQWINLDFNGWMSIAYSTIFGSAVAYGIFFYLATHSNLTSFSSLTFLTPVFALGFSSFFLSEVLSPVKWLGICITLVSVYLINQRQYLEKLLSKSRSSDGKVILSQSHDVELTKEPNNLTPIAFNKLQQD